MVHGFEKSHAHLNQPIYSYKNNFAVDIDIVYDFNVFRRKFKEEK